MTDSLPFPGEENVNQNGETTTETEKINCFTTVPHYCRSLWQDFSRLLIDPLFPYKFTLFCDVFVLFFFFSRKRYRKVLYYVVVIQKNYRAFSSRRRFLCLKKAAIVLQKQRRGQIARRVFRERLEEKRRQEEERRKEEEERCSMLPCITHIRFYSEQTLLQVKPSDFGILCFF